MKKLFYSQELQNGRWIRTYYEYDETVNYPTVLEVIYVDGEFNQSWATEYTPEEIEKVVAFKLKKDNDYNSYMNS